MENKKKKLTLIITSALSLGVLSFVIVNNTLDKSVLTAHGGEQARTATANKDTTKRGLYASEQGQIYNAVAFSLNDENVYNIINTSQLQDGITEENNCVFALWGQENDGISFAINTGIYSEETVYTDNTKQNALSTVRFRHLNKIDFILDNSDDHRLTTLCETTEYGTIVKSEESENTVKWTWTANTYISDNDVPMFSSPDEHTLDKAIWMREIVFYYDC